MLTVQFSQQEFAKVLLQNHRIRDVFYLVVMKTKEGGKGEKIQKEEKVKSEGVQGQVKDKEKE